jgi:hypothetical protein
MKKNTELVVKRLQTKDEAVQELMQVDDDYESYIKRLPDNIKRRVVNSLNSTKNTFQSVAPLVCGGPERCPFIDKCPIPSRDQNGELQYPDASMFPIGKECLLEKIFMQQKTIQYLERLNVDPNDPIEMSVLNELALIDLYKNRAMMIMSVGDRSGQGRDFMRIDIMGFNENGDTAEQAKLHPAVEFMDKLEKRRQKYLEQLMETRQRKAEWMLRVGNAKEESKILSELKKLRETLKSIEAEGGQDDEDIFLDD